MIDISKLTDADIGRNVTYHREHCAREYGKLSSWNADLVFVRFKGPTGEACEPADVSFDFIRKFTNPAPKFADGLNEESP